MNEQIHENTNFSIIVVKAWTQIYPVKGYEKYDYLYGNIDPDLKNTNNTICIALKFFAKCAQWCCLHT